MAPSLYDDKTNEPYVSTNFPHMEELVQRNIKQLREKLKKVSLTVRQKIRVIGEGEYSIVVRSSDDTIVLKLMDYNLDFMQECRMLKHMNKQARKARNPLAPHYYKGFTVNREFGVIVMQNITDVYKDYTDLYTYKPQHFKLLKQTVKRLHDYGVHHGDLKPDHIYIFTYPNDKYKLSFIDYGLSYKVNTLTSDEVRLLEIRNIG